MKLKHTTTLLFFVCYSLLLHAQGKLTDSLINNSKTNSELKIYNKTTDKINDKIDKAFDGDLFKKKKKKGSGDEAFQVGPGKSLITINGADFTSLSSFSDALKTNTQVKEVEREFSNGVGVLKVSHNGSADQLLDDLLKKAGGKLDVIETSGGKINLKMK